MAYRSRRLYRLLNAWPGERWFGVYRFLPAFFFLGAALEFSMIHWTVGPTNFYNTFKKRKAEEIVQAQIHSPLTPRVEILAEIEKSKEKITAASSSY